MKIYYICEYCEQVFSVIESGEEEGAVEVKGICEDCAMEMGLMETPLHNQHFYS